MGSDPSRDLTWCDRVARRFDYFVILAEMRTGSNALEDALNGFTAIQSYGEVFNPAFIAKPKTKSFFGVTLEQREKDPVAAINALRSNTEGMGGFRLFSDHDSRALEHVLTDPDCAKIWLTRNPLDSFVSLQIANATGQWWVSDVGDAKSAQIDFDPDAFERYLTKLRLRQNDIQRRLQSAGQTAFPIDYADLGDETVLTGIARYLGVSEDRSEGGRGGIIQNPVPMDLKVRNFDEMVTALGQRDHYSISEDISYEPERGPGVPSYVALDDPALVFMPVRGAPNPSVETWMGDLASRTGGKITRDHTQTSLRKWMRDHPGHRSFTILSHPLRRAHRAFCQTILTGDEGYFGPTRTYLSETYDCDLADAGTDPDAHRAAFLAFLKFMKANLGGQTPIWTEPEWGLQIAQLQGMARFVLPDILVREASLTRDLGLVLANAGWIGDAPEVGPEPSGATDLAGIVDKDIQNAARAAYRQDYIMLGFSDWAPDVD